MIKIRGGVTSPKGFLANGINCGIKRKRPDLALLVSEKAAIFDAMFTQNKVKAAPIIVDQLYIKEQWAKGIVVNSGNANCCNGKAGIKAATDMSKAAAKVLGVSNKKILVASTGIIGKAFPIGLVKKAMPDLIKGLKRGKGTLFAKTIMTTDKFCKEAAVKIKIGGTNVTIGGTAKGAGMIHPNMATMLCFITTDAAIEKSALKSAFRQAVAGSFNSMSVDGSTSTNDSVFILANGMAGNKPIQKGTSAYERFSDGLAFVARELARKIILDGEGATKLIKISVKNAKSQKDARNIAETVATDLLFKTSVYGEDPNWGRIAAAAGRSSADIALDKLDIFIGAKKVLQGGKGLSADKEALRKIYKKKEITITIDLKLGRKSAEFITCDISHKYVDINASYN